ncbi:MAG: 3D-(3,5/4)-trihydroxycyclohexane-1,2-dione acylhydrolase (decyclizing) [Deltaproteobacteria bacterium]|nr:3D-(3,5/4)-trihydroxycyclohexane-1,2-dione acylhydrolase (decyclizing) [Deltaproteobacteria bacterium]
MSTVRLTMAQALVRYLASQRIQIDGRERALFRGVFAIFGHGNVAGVGEALARERERLPTLRAHNEQGMAHAAIAYAKTQRRRRMMACTTSIGPGATNLVTAAATAHLNRIPVLLLPGDVFASRRPDPVLQQLEALGEPTRSANDCLRPVSRYWDRITRPEQLLAALPEAMRVLLDPAETGPVTLALPQDVQTEAYDYPTTFFEPERRTIRRPAPDPAELERAVAAIRRAQRPLIIAGGGVLYAGAEAALARFAELHRIPVCETQAGKSTLAFDHPAAMGGVGVTGSGAANALAAEADLVLAIGTRLSDFTTASRSLFQSPRLTLIALNVAAFDAHKHGAVPLVADAALALEGLERGLTGWSASQGWWQRAGEARTRWQNVARARTETPASGRLSDAQVLGAVNRAAGPKDLVVCAAGGLPGELHKLWEPKAPASYHLEYGYSCMGYEIAGGLGARLARDEGEVFVFVGDGSYLMMSSELATAVMMDQKLILILIDNRGFGCIHRLQSATAGERFNNLLPGPEQWRGVDFRAHAESLGAVAERAANGAELERAIERARARQDTSVIVVETDPSVSTQEGGAWWDVAVAEVSTDPAVRAASQRYQDATGRQRVGHRSDAAKIRLGINPLTWSNDDLPELGGETPLETCLTEAKLVGFEGVELGHKFPRNAKTLGPILEAHGLSLVSGWYSSALLERSLDEEKRAVEPHLSLLRALGCSVMVFAETTGAVHGERGTGLSRRPVLEPARFEKLARALEAMGEHLAQEGLTLAYHHHMGTVIQSEEEIDRLMAVTGPAVGLLLDTGHLSYAGGDPVRAAKKHAGRIVHVHLKDVRRPVLEAALAADRPFLAAVVEGVFTVPGDGAVDYPGVLSALAAGGYRGWLVVEAEQDPKKAHPLTYAKLGHDNARRLVHQAGL